MSSASGRAQRKKKPAGKGPTPMMAQYLRLKAEHPDALLLFRMGDFYETFYEDAEIAAQLLGLTLTSREKQGEAPIPLAGVPFHALDHYLTRLVAAGQTVAICEQTEDPAQAKGLVRREVVEVVSPGTVTDPALLEESESLFLLALLPDEDRWGYALLDSSTGDFRCGEGSADEVAGLGRRYRVAEVLVAEARAESEASERMARDFAAASLTPVSDLLFESGFAEKTLCEHFGVQSSTGLGLGESPRAAAAAGAALRYLSDRQRRRPAQVRDLRVDQTRGSLQLDRETIAHLELFEGLRVGERETSLFHHLDLTGTPMGRRRLAHWLRTPLAEREPIEARLDGVEALWEAPRTRERLHQGLEGMGDLERIAGRIATERALPHQLAALRDGLDRVPELCSALERSEAALLRRLEQHAPVGTEISRELRAALADAPPTHLRQGGIFRDGFDEELDRLRDLDRGGKSWIAGYQEEQRERTGIANLKVGFNRVFGYHLEVTNKHLDKVPDHYVEKQRLTSAKRYVTEALKEREQEILRAQDDRVRREQELFGELVRGLAPRLDDLHALLDAVSEVDALASLAEVAARRHFVRPVIDDSGEIDVEEGRHPVVEALSREPFTPNGLEMNAARRLLILTGPNMGGKSTYLRQAALMVVLAQMGSFVPAGRARIGLVDRVFTRVGASDNLARGQSTFLVEMEETARILRSCTDDSLVIFDEVGRGTSTSDGRALAHAITEYLHDGPVRPKSLFATHFHELTALGERLERGANIQMEVREWEGRILFLHRVIAGAGDQSYGVHVAELAGVPEAVLERARQILRENSSDPEAGSPPAAAPPQIPLFNGDGRAEELRRRLRELDPDTLRPVEALQILAELVDRARD